MLARIDRLSAGIDDLTEVTGQLLAPCEEQLAQAESMPGWGRRAAQDAVAETGVDMSRFHPGAHLSSWVGRLPGQPGLRDGFARRHLLGEALRLAGHAPLQRRPVQRLIRRVPPARGQV